MSEEGKVQSVPMTDIRGENAPPLTLVQEQSGLIDQVDIVVYDTRQEFVKFLIDILGFQRSKVYQLIGAHIDIASVDDWLDYYAPISENGLQSHEFIPIIEDLPEEQKMADDQKFKDIEMIDGLALDQLTSEIKTERIEIKEEICAVCKLSRKNHSTFLTCNICYQKKRSDDFYMLVQCGHEFCTLCLRSNLESLVKDCNIGKLKCLEYECKEVINDEQAEGLLDAETFKKFKRYRKSIEVDKNPDLFWCPGPNCEQTLKKSEVMKQKLQNGNWTCTTCKCEICKKCQTVAHKGKPCPEAHESAFRSWATSGTGVKNCPNCRARTEKNDGCNHMACHRCRHNWCWICGQTANELHYEQTRIFTGCPGLQFIAAEPWKLALMMMAAFILNPIVFALAPPIIAFVFGIKFAWRWTDLSLRCCCRNSCCLYCLFGPMLFLLYWVIIESAFLAASAIASALLVGIGSPLFMLYIIFFACRLIILNCKTFK